MTNSCNADRQSELFPELIPHTGHGSGSAMAAMLMKRREVATEPAPLLAGMPQDAKDWESPKAD